MMKIIKKLLFLVISFLLLLMLMTKWNFNNSSAFDMISTFLSISTGFSITALSIIATSSFSQFLYSIEDSNDNSKTLLHQLIRRFKVSTLFFIFTIGLILIFKFVPDISDTIFSISIYPVSLRIILKSSIWYLTLICFVSFLNLFNLFIKFILRSATHRQ